jgi:S-adenosylmethionine:tRNA ribosyltransferase-isomerase
MLISDFDFVLPEGLIAQQPLADRDASRMLIVDRASGEITDDVFANFAARLRSDDVVVLNNTKVFPARLKGITSTGANVEVFLIRQIGECTWEALVKPLRRLKTGKLILFGDQMRGKTIGITSEGRAVIEFDYTGDFFDRLDATGKTPLPPYIKRDAGSLDDDRDRYQTVFAASAGAIAAPTAGLHFTPEVLSTIRANGNEIVEITLHVGYGTFEPVRAEDLSEHRVMPERYDVSEGAAEALNSATAAGRRIVAIGTTTTRTLENMVSRHGAFVAESAEADLTITPGYSFKAVGAMLTNFHLPKSSLLVLVSTFGGHELIMNAYDHAVREQYRFYSYGDCMFVA